MRHFSGDMGIPSRLTSLRRRRMRDHFNKRFYNRRRNPFLSNPCPLNGNPWGVKETGYDPLRDRNRLSSHREYNKVVDRLFQKFSNRRRNPEYGYPGFFPKKKMSESEIRQHVKGLRREGVPIQIIRNALRKTPNDSNVIDQIIKENQPPLPGYIQRGREEDMGEDMGEMLPARNIRRRNPGYLSGTAFEDIDRFEPIRRRNPLGIDPELFDRSYRRRRNPFSGEEGLYDSIYSRKYRNRLRRRNPFNYAYDGKQGSGLFKSIYRRRRNPLGQDNSSRSGLFKSIYGRRRRRYRSNRRRRHFRGF